MHKHKFAVACLIFVIAAVTMGDWEPWLPRASAGYSSSLVILTPVGLFIWGVVRFARWHGRVVHPWIIAEMTRPRRSGSQ
jgi:hypothetical protein